MAKPLFGIDDKSKGLRGFVRDLEHKLEEELVDRFSGRVKEDKIDVRYIESHPYHLFQLFWFYNGSKYDFSGAFFLEKQDDGLELTIERFPGVVTHDNSKWPYPRASPNELRIAADMEEVVKGFLDERFGESTSKRVNGCPIYRTYLPEEFRSEVA